jgi:hypothetical protein
MKIEIYYECYEILQIWRQVIALNPNPKKKYTINVFCCVIFLWVSHQFYIFLITAVLIHYNLH